MNETVFTVWVGGVEVNDHYLPTKIQADALAQEWRNKGYDDVAVEQVGECPACLWHYPTDEGLWVSVSWEVMGDPRTSVKVCRNCGEHDEVTRD